MRTPIGSRGLWPWISRRLARKRPEAVQPVTLPPVRSADNSALYQSSDADLLTDSSRVYQSGGKPPRLRLMDNRPVDECSPETLDPG